MIFNLKTQTNRFSLPKLLIFEIRPIKGRANVTYGSSNMASSCLWPDYATLLRYAILLCYESEKP